MWNMPENYLIQLSVTLCLVWYHLPCIGKSNAPKKRFWFCSECYQIYSERNAEQKDGTGDEVLLVSNADMYMYILYGYT